jgi:hypothetical protein
MITPAFNLTFTTAVLDPRITFTRSAATATRVNSSGLVEVMAADTPRFDFNPATLICRGLLIEESRINLIRYSNELATSPWTTVTSGAASVTRTNNAAVSPDGTSNATKLEFSATASGELATVREATTVTAGTSYAPSIYLRADSPVTVYVRKGDQSASEAVAVTTSWQRFTLTPGAAGSTTHNFDISTKALSANTTSAVTVYVYGAQLEAGAFATSYIPTTSAAVTRNADVATITGTAFSGFWRSGPGSILVRALPSTVSGTRPLVQVDDTTADNIIALRGNTTNPELYIREGGADQATIDAGTISAAAYRLAGAWQAGSAAASLNSGLAVNGAPASIPAATQMRLGSDGTNYLNGHLQAVEYWPLRLSNASLQNASSTAGYQSIIHPVSRDTIITEPV